MPGSVTALVGAQFGSEGKGLVAAKMASEFEVHVRTGAPNAGHTYYAEVSGDKRLLHEPDKVKIVARSVPCGAINQHATLVIGAGAYIDIDLLIQEVAALDAMGWEVSGRLLVDENASIIHPVRHHAFEGGVDGAAHKRIGSTGEGVGPARMARIARGTFSDHLPWAKLELVKDSAAALNAAEHGMFRICDTAHALNTMYDQGLNILLEGTQGSGLSMVHGPWPFTTSTDTNAGQMAVDAGLAPQLVDSAILVARAHPIRVAGNSGPLPNEVTWADIGQPEERTTVTKKVRRVGLFSPATVRRAVMLNRPSGVVITFYDYQFPMDKGATDWKDLCRDGIGYLEAMEEQIGCPIIAAGTGPDSLVMVPSDEVHGRFLGSVKRTWTPGPWPARGHAYGQVEL